MSSKTKKLVLVADVFYPHNTSASVQLGDLSLEFQKQGYDITIIVPGETQKESWTIDEWNGVRVVRLKTPRIKKVNLVRRFFAEISLPFFIISNLKKSPVDTTDWDGVIWYSPTIFLGLVARYLKRVSQSRAYLIIRDIFPDWAVNVGVMRKGPPYYFLKRVEYFQYKVADAIGVETPSNLAYFNSWKVEGVRDVHVLENWIAPATNQGCSIDLTKTRLWGRRLLVYAGTLGIPQNIKKLVQLATELKDDDSIGFIVVGHGSEENTIKEMARNNQLKNILFFDAIPSHEVIGLYEQCSVGLMTLDHRHKTFNVPGKFVSYVQAGLPVLASINPGNDLVDIIGENNIGRVVTNDNNEELGKTAYNLLSQLETDHDIKERCRTVAQNRYMPEVTVSKILKSLEISND